MKYHLALFCLAFITILKTNGQDSATIARLKKSLDNVKTVADEVQLYSDIAWEFIMDSNDSALVYADRALKIATDKKYPFGQAIAYESKGLYYEMVKGDYDKASTFYFDGIQVCDLNDLPYKSSLYLNLGVMFHTSDNYDKALEYYNITYNLAQKVKDSGLIKNCLINLGSIHSSKGEYDNATYYFEKSFDYKGRSDLDYPTYANLGNLYIKQKKYDKALAYLNRSVIQGPDNPDAELNLYLLIHLKALTRDTLGMSAIIDRANTLIDDEVIGLRDKSLFVMYLGDYYKAIGKHKPALNYRERYINLYDSIKKGQRDEVVLEMETKYATAQKNLEIERQTVQIEKQKILRQRLLWGLATTLLLLVLGGVFFWKHLQYQKTISDQDRLLQRQKIADLEQQAKLVALNGMIEGQETERLRIAKDLHDSLGGLLSTVKAHFTALQLEKDPKAKQTISDKTQHLIDEACVDVRRISHNMIPHTLSLSGLPEVLEDFTQGLKTEGYKVELDIRDFPAELPKPKQAMLYRLIQEIVSNIRKHAQASQILIQMFGSTQGLGLIIEDDGRGFDFKTAVEKGGLGLKSINSRVAFLNGTIDWDTVPNRGTTITVNISFDAK
jgi:signal transduction histidine kinase